MGTGVAYRWDVETFLRAQAAAVFPFRVELVEGEVWPVVLGDWHGRATTLVVVALAAHGVVTQSTLASGDSLPDPDVWLQRAAAVPVEAVSPRLSRWDPRDVLLVVEVSDETLEQDLTVKAELYARSGYQRYWAVSREGVHEHTRPGPSGYGAVTLRRPGESVALPGGAPVEVAVLLPPE